MHTSGSGGRVRCTFFSFALFPRSMLTNWVGGGEKGVPVGLNLRGGAFSMNARGSGARAHRTSCFTYLAFQFSLSRELGVRISAAGYPRRWRFFVHMTVYRKVSARKSVSSFCASADHFSRTGWEGRYSGVSLLSIVAILESCQWIGRANGLDVFIFCASTVQFPRT